MLVRRVLPTFPIEDARIGLSGYLPLAAHSPDPYRPTRLATSPMMELISGTRIRWAMAT